LAGTGLLADELGQLPTFPTNAEDTSAVEAKLPAA
jgi:hypothetical protein